VRVIRAVFIVEGPPINGAERREKKMASHREGHVAVARPVTDFRIAGDVEKNTAGL
jgi:hypothetical protein